MCSLGRVFQWEPLLETDDPILEGDKRQGLAILFAQYLLGSLDFAPNPMNISFLNVPMGLASREFMVNYFSRTDPSKVIWFPIEEED